VRHALCPPGDHEDVAAPLTAVEVDRYLRVALDVAQPGRAVHAVDHYRLAVSDEPDRPRGGLPVRGDSGQPGDLIAGQPPLDLLAPFECHGPTLPHRARVARPGPRRPGSVNVLRVIDV